MKSFERIVLGLGGMGSAALCHLASRSTNVLGIEQHGIAHDKGSSHGQTRIIRQAYFEHPDYVPLLKVAYELWDALEQQTESNLFERVGLLEFGLPHGELVHGIRASVAVHGVQVDELDPQQLAELAPHLKLPDGFCCLFERNAGYLHVERCVQKHVEVAIHRGAQIIATQQARLELGGKQLKVHVDGGETYHAEGVVVCAGAWTPALLPLPVTFRILRKHLHWFDLDLSRAHELPAFFYELPSGCFYGFPDIAKLGMKICEHSGGEAIDDVDEDDRSLELQDLARVKQAIEQMISTPSIQHLRHATCMYTMSPDEHFIIDRHPDDERIVFAAGMSGHGFKFASVIGKLLSQLSLDGKTSLAVDFLRLNRERFGA